MTKVLIGALALVLACSPAGARCMPTDFEVIGFSATAHDNCRLSPCPVLALTGELQNHCAEPAGAMLKVTAHNAEGRVIATTQGWPASVQNIAPGSRFPFDLGPLMHYDAAISRFEVLIIDARTW